MNKRKNFTKDELKSMIQTESEAKIVIETGIHTISLNEFDISENKVTVNITDSRTFYEPLEDNNSDEPNKYTGYICETEFSFEFEGKHYTAGYEDFSHITKEGDIVCVTDRPSITEPFDCDDAPIDIAYAIVLHFCNLKFQQWHESHPKS